MIAHVGKPQILRVIQLDQGDSVAGENFDAADQGLGQIVIQITVSFTYVYLQYTEQGRIMTHQAPFETFQHRDNRHL